MKLNKRIRTLFRVVLRKNKIFAMFSLHFSAFLLQLNRKPFFTASSFFERNRNSVGNRIALQASWAI